MNLIDIITTFPELSLEENIASMSYGQYEGITPMEFALSLINTFNKDVPSSKHMGSIILVSLGETNINNIRALCLENIRQIGVIISCFE